MIYFSLDVDNVGAGFHMDVENGSRPDDGRCNTKYGIKTRVILVCNSSVQWSTNDLTGLIEVAYLEDTDPCDVSKWLNLHYAYLDLLVLGIKLASQVIGYKYWKGGGQIFRCSCPPPPL